MRGAGSAAPARAGVWPTGYPRRYPGGHRAHGSAGIADTAAADGNLRKLSGWMRGPRPYLASGTAAVVLAATVPTYTIVAVASRAFAAYYALQAVLALRTSHRISRKLAYGALAVLMAAITVLAKPAS